MTSQKVVFAVVVFLGLIALVALGGSITLTAFDKNVPDGLWTIGGGALGGLTGLLASTRSAPPDPPAPADVTPAPGP